MSYAQLHKQANFKEGEQVRVTRIAERREKGWENSWPDDMDKAVGKTFTICRIDPKTGIKLSFSTFYWFPVFVLERVRTKIRVG